MIWLTCSRRRNPTMRRGGYAGTKLPGSTGFCAPTAVHRRTLPQREQQQPSGIEPRELAATAAQVQEIMAQEEEADYQRQRLLLEPQEGYAKFVAARRRAHSLRSRCQRERLSPESIQAEVYATVAAMRQSMLASEPNDDCAIKAYERVVAPYAKARLFRMWPATFQSLHFFVTDFLAEVSLHSGHRPTARGAARPYVSRIIKHSRLCDPSGTISKDEQTDLNRWIRSLQLLDQFRTRHAFPFSEDMLRKLHQWCQDRHGRRDSLKRLQTYTAVLVSCQLAMRTHNVVNGLQCKDVIVTPNGKAAVIRLSRPKGKASAAKEQIPIVESGGYADALSWLKKYSRVQFGRSLRWMAAHQPTVPLFPKEKVRGSWVPWTEARMLARMKQACRDAGVSPMLVKRLSLRSGRHAFATEARQKGCPDPTIQQFTGHQSLRGVQPYAHVPVLAQLKWQQRIWSGGSDDE